MNPEDQNPTTNPAAPTAGSSPNPSTTPDSPADSATLSSDSTTLSPADSLAAAQENLTAAANAAAADATVTSDPTATSTSSTVSDPALANPSDPTVTADTGMSNSTVTSADTTAIIDEPLVPAAPVPGSIGSVTSVPPAADATTATPTDNAFAAAAAAEPAATPFNPFTQPAEPIASSTNPISTTDSSSTPDPFSPTDSAPTMDPISSTNPTPAASTDSLNPIFQPAQPGATSAPHAAKKPAVRPQFLTLILGIVAGVFLTATIVLAILYINALNNQEIVYYPQATEPESTTETLSCTQTLDLAYLAGSPTPVNGNRLVTATYTDDALIAMSVNYDATYNNDVDANTARANLEAAQVALVNTPESSFVATYSVNGATMSADLQSVDDFLTNDAAETLLFGSISGNPDAMTRAGLETTLTQAGATCTVE